MHIDVLNVCQQDRMLAELLTEKKDWIVNYIEHDSLLENKVEEDLTEEERKSAWEEYEQEKKGIRKSYSCKYSPFFVIQGEFKFSISGVWFCRPVFC